MNKRCNRCKELSGSCKCKPTTNPKSLSEIKPVLRLEKAHRGGKEVTIIDRLPASESFLKELSQELKKKCGSGGTYKIRENTGTIEIQGNKIDQLKNELKRLGCKM